MSKSWLPLCFLPHLTLPVVAIDVLPTVPVDVSSSINLLEAGVWCWPGSCVEETHVADSCGAWHPPHPRPTMPWFFFWDGWSMGNFCCLLQASEEGEKAPQTLPLIMVMEGTTALRRVNIIAGQHI